jgi:signal transduction histidine kinase
MKRAVILLCALMALALGVGQAVADDTAAAALASESEAYCASTLNKERPTPPAMVVDKVNQACALLEKEGAAAFPKFSGHGSAFLYEGTYVWVHTLAEGKMLVHPIKHKMVGNNLIGLKDTRGKRFFVTMNDLVSEKGEGWVEYYWPKPGTEDAVRKISFVKKCRLPDGTEVVVGSGLVNFSDADVAKLDLH